MLCINSKYLYLVIIKQIPIIQGELIVIKILKEYVQKCKIKYLNLD